MKHKNKPEHLLINKKSKESQVFLLVNCRFLSIFIFFVDNNLMVYTKLERLLHHFKYNLYDILMAKLI